MPAPAGGQGNEPDNSLAALWITLGVFIAFGFIWYYLKDEIITFVLTVRGYEAALISFFVPQAWSQSLVEVQQYIANAKSGAISNINVDDLVNISNQIGDYLKYPVAIILLGLAFIVYLRNATARYKKAYTMQSLLKAEKHNWPFIIPVANLNLVDEDINKGPWAMATKPMDFAKQHGILILEKIIPSDATLANKAVITAKINQEEARKIFAQQMGKYWVSPDKLPIHAKALFAVFAARIVGDKDGPEKLLIQIARSSETGKLDFSGAEDLLKKHRDNKIVARVCKRHAFVLTVMATMLETARQDGVVATADFIWLKPVDRPLWLFLNSVGRQTPFVEIGGPFAHWIVENEMGRRLNVPMIEEAVRGLEEAVKELIYTPDEENEAA